MPTVPVVPTGPTVPIVPTWPTLSSGLAPAGEVWHFSEDPGITEFRPHVAATAQQAQAYVWAVDGARCPDYWFPRQCPRAMAWRPPEDGAGAQVGGADRDAAREEADRLLGRGVERVHVIEYAWLGRLLSTTVYAYPFDAADFRPFGDPPHAQVAERSVRPLRAPGRIVDLVQEHARAAIELRVVHDLFPWWEQVVASGLGYSGIRLRNAGRSLPDVAAGR